MIRNLTLRQIAVALTPIVVGFGLSILLQQGWFGAPNPRFETQFDLAWLLSSVGMLATFIIIFFLNNRALNAQKESDTVSAKEQINFEKNQEFLRRLDHELKNPLTIIRLGISNLQEGKDLDGLQRASIRRIDHQIDRLRRLVVDLRRLTELQAEDLETEIVDVTDVLSEAITLAKESLLSPRKINLSIQTTPWSVSNIRGDRELLILAFLNLIDNGLKYTEPTNQVDVRVSDDGEQVVVEVADNGMGIPADELPYIFENLYRGERARGVQGSGLGLPLVARIIHLHGGAISVISKNKTGISFSVSIPITS